MRLKARIDCPDTKIGSGFEVGPDVVIKARRLIIGDNVRIGVENEESFRNPGGVRISAESVTIDDGVQIERCVLIKGGNLHLGRETAVKERCSINVKEQLVLGPKSYLNPHCRLFGRHVTIGSNFRMLTWALIGGGSCFEKQSKLKIGHSCHLGEFSQINTADSVLIGNEVGIGIRSCVFTHGAYQSVLKGYPVSFGSVEIQDNCWLPHAYVLPNVTIGKGTVVAAGSVVVNDLPEFCLAGGVPAKVIREGIYAVHPDVSQQKELLREFMVRLNQILVDNYGEASGHLGEGVMIVHNGRKIVYAEGFDADSSDYRPVNDEEILISLETRGNLAEFCEKFNCTIIALDRLETHGDRNSVTDRIIDQFRRYGVRLER